MINFEIDKVIVVINLKAYCYIKIKNVSDVIRKIDKQIDDYLTECFKNERNIIVIQRGKVWNYKYSRLDYIFKTREILACI